MLVAAAAASWNVDPASCRAQKRVVTHTPTGSGWGTYLAQVAEIEVTGSGDVRVRRIVCAVDCGQVVNPAIVKAQIESGVVYGISGALWGEVTLKDGRVEQSNFNNYRVLRMNETPPIEVHLIRNSEAPGGIGEPGTAVTAAALGNAIYAATGKRLRKLPLQPGLMP
jgi:CO/xanthine dehydrogenase Mo-binding subunit